METVAKCREEARRWFEAIATSKGPDAGRTKHARAVNMWKAPELGRFKCNVGVAWDQKTRMVGGGWIVRNNEGGAILHSRRAFNGASSLIEAKRLGFIWAVESMISHKMHKVTFDVESSELAGVVNKPKAWPAFRGMGVEFGEALSNITEWEVSAV